MNSVYPSSMLPAPRSPQYVRPIRVRCSVCSELCPPETQRAPATTHDYILNACGWRKPVEKLSVHVFSVCPAGATASTTWSCGCGSACTPACSASCWSPRTPATSSSTWRASPRRASPASSPSSSSPMPSRRWWVTPPRGGGGGGGSTLIFYWVKVVIPAL